MNNFYARLLLAVIVVTVLAQAIPEIVNTVLILIFVGIILNRYGAFNQLFALISSTGKADKK